MGIRAEDIPRLGKGAQQQIAAKLAVTLVESRKHMERRSKYGAELTPVEMENGEVYKFRSKAEAKRFRELHIMMMAGEIRELKLQPHFTLQEPYMRPTGEKVKREEYVADFSYERRTKPDCNGKVYWLQEVEDVKGVRTSMYLRKKNQMLALYGITIKEV